MNQYMEQIAISDDVEKLKSCGPRDFERRNDCGRTPFLTACIFGSNKVAEYLLQKFCLDVVADIQCEFHEEQLGYTGLMFACESRELGIVHLILQHAPAWYINKRNSQNKTALEIIMEVGDRTIIEFFLASDKVHVSGKTHAMSRLRGTRFMKAPFFRSFMTERYVIKSIPIDIPTIRFPK